VLFTFLSRQEYVEREADYPWRSEVPGSINARLAPQYWIWQDANFTPQQAKARFAGLIQHLVYSPTAPPPDMRKVLERIELDIYAAKAADRPAMLMLYWLWNALVSEEYKGPKWGDLVSQFGDVIDKCRIESATALLLVNQQTPDEWPLTELVAVIEQYQRSRYKALEIHLPLPVEIGLLANIANKYLALSELEGYRQWAGRAIVDAAGRKNIQDTLRHYIENREPIDVRAIIGWPVPSMMRAAGHEKDKPENNDGQLRGECQEQQPENANKKDAKPVRQEPVTRGTGLEISSAEPAADTQQEMKSGKEGQSAD
jgi:hypothetical protein